MCRGGVRRRGRCKWVCEGEGVEIWGMLDGGLGGGGGGGCTYGR